MSVKFKKAQLNSSSNKKFTFFFFTYSKKNVIKTPNQQNKGISLNNPFH